MKDHDRHVDDQLSAYLDGEADDPVTIARHLQQCAACARRYMELSRLSAHIRALPVQEAPPEFVTRVMAHVKDTPSEPSFSWSRIWWPLAGVAVTLLLIVTAVGVHSSGYLGAPMDSAAVAWNTWKNVDVEAATTTLAMRLAQVGDPVISAAEGVVDIGTLLNDETADATAEGASTDDDVAVIAALVSGDDAVTYQYLGDPQAEIQTMDEGQREALKELLASYSDGRST